MYLTKLKICISRTNYLCLVGNNLSSFISGKFLLKLGVFWEWKVYTRFFFFHTRTFAISRWKMVPTFSTRIPELCFKSYRYEKKSKVEKLRLITVSQWHKYTERNVGFNNAKSSKVKRLRHFFKKMLMDNRKHFHIGKMRRGFSEWKRYININKRSRSLGIRTCMWISWIFIFQTLKISACVCYT